MQPQPGIKSFFKPVSGKAKAAGRRQPSSAVQCDEAEQPAAPAVQQFARKRKRLSDNVASAVEPAAAAPAGASGGAPPAAAPAVARAGTAAAEAAAPRQRQLMQMYLDVGQRNFHSLRCPTCGMVYARGTEADERLHAAFHTSATQGPRYQGWQGERLVQADGGKGRVLLLSSADQGRGRKQVQELWCFLEEQMGLPQGWLQRAPLTLLLYVSAARRIQACVAAEGIRGAHRVQPSLPPSVAHNMRSCGSAAVAPPSPSGSSGGGCGAAAPPAAAVAAAQVATSGRSLLSVTLSSGAATATAECYGGSDTARAADGKAVEQQQQQQEEKEGSSKAAACCQQQGRAQAADAAGQQQQQQGGALASGASSPQSPAQRQGQQQRSHPTPPAGDCQQPFMQPQQHQPAAAAAPPPGPAAADRPPLALDRSQRVRAVCGVRLMWVSLEARRRGLATRLLDCCRCQFMPGYVLPRHELAFSAPTDDGRAFIESYAGTRRFLVYEQ